MDVTERLLRLGSPHVLVVATPQSTGVRLRLERELRVRGWTEAASPADADLLFVCGRADGALDGAVRRVWDQLPSPRALASAPQAHEVALALDRALSVLADVGAMRADAATRWTPDDGEGEAAEAAPMDHGAMGAAPMDHGQMDHGAMGAAPMGAVPMDHESMGAAPMDHGQMDHGQMDHESMGAAPMDAAPMDAAPMDHGQMGHESMGAAPMDHGQMDHGAMGGGQMDHAGHGQHGGHEGHGMQMDLPGGLTMAERADDRDGLRLDRLTLVLGPILAAWPTGLVLRLTIQGDIVQTAEVEAKPAPADAPSYWVPAGDDREADGLLQAAAAADSLQRFLAVAGWSAASLGIRRLRDELLDGGQRVSGASARWLRRVRRSRVLRWSTVGVGVAGGDDATLLGADAAARVRRWTDRIAAALEPGVEASPSAFPAPDPAVHARAVVSALPHLVVGAELASVRLTVASLDPDLDALRAPVPAHG